MWQLLFSEKPWLERNLDSPDCFCVVVIIWIQTLSGAKWCWESEAHLSNCPQKIFYMLSSMFSVYFLTCYIAPVLVISTWVETGLRFIFRKMLVRWCGLATGWQSLNLALGANWKICYFLMQLWSKRTGLMLFKNW